MRHTARLTLHKLQEQSVAVAARHEIYVAFAQRELWLFEFQWLN